MPTASSLRCRPRGWLSTACGAWLLCAQAHALDGTPGTPAPAWDDTPVAARLLADLHTQLAVQARAWVRVDVQIEAASDTPGAAWLRELADRATRLLASLPAGSYRALDRPVTQPSLTLEIDDAALAVLEDSPWVAAVEPLPPSPLMTHSGEAPTVQRAPEPIADEYVVVLRSRRSAGPRAGWGNWAPKSAAWAPAWRPSTRASSRRSGITPCPGWGCA